MTQQESLSIRVENMDGEDEDDLNREIFSLASSTSDLSDVGKSTNATRATTTLKPALDSQLKLDARGQIISKPSNNLVPHDFNRDEANKSKMAMPFSAKVSRQLTSSNQSAFFDQLLGLSKSSSFISQKRMAFESCDLDFLRKTKLFAEWNNDDITKFIEEDRIRLKKTKNNEIIADGDECKDNIYIVKSGSMVVWVKMTRDHINYHEKKLKQEIHEKNNIASNASKPQSALYPSSTQASRLSSRKESKILSSKPTIDTSTRSQPNFSQATNSNLNLPRLNEKKSQVIFKAASACVEKLPTVSASLGKRHTASKSSLNMMHANSTIGFNNLPKANSTLSAKSLRSVPTRPPSLKVAELKPSYQTTLNPPDRDSSLLDACTDIWKNSFPSNQTSCFLEFVKLSSGEIFGLSDFLFDVEREKANLIEINYNNRMRQNPFEEKSPQEKENKNECNKMSNYHLMSGGACECYIIDREYYFKTLYSILNDKHKINELFDSLRLTCTKLPLNQEVDEKFMKYLIWNIYKKHIYNDQLRIISTKRTIRHYYNPNRSRFLATNSLV